MERQAELVYGGFIVLTAIITYLVFPHKIEPYVFMLPSTNWAVLLLSFLPSLIFFSITLSLIGLAGLVNLSNDVYLGSLLLSGAAIFIFFGLGSVTLVFIPIFLVGGWLAAESVRKESQKRIHIHFGAVQSGISVLVPLLFVGILVNFVPAFQFDGFAKYVETQGIDLPTSLLQAALSSGAVSTLEEYKCSADTTLVKCAENIAQAQLEQWRNDEYKKLETDPRCAGSIFPECKAQVDKASVDALPGTTSSAKGALMKQFSLTESDFTETMTVAEAAEVLIKRETVNPELKEKLGKSLIGMLTPYKDLIPYAAGAIIFTLLTMATWPLSFLTTFFVKGIFQLLLNLEVIKIIKVQKEVDVIV